MQLRKNFVSVKQEVLELLPILQGVSDFTDFSVAGSKEPLLSRMRMAVDNLLDAAKPGLSSESARVKSVATSFVASVHARFDNFLSSQLALASEFLDPYVAYKMQPQNFMAARGVILQLMPKPEPPPAAADFDMFAAAGVVAEASINEQSMLTYVQLVKEISLKPPPADKTPSSLQFWSERGSDIKPVRRVYMNLASVPMSSVPSECVFSQLGNVITDRRGSMLSDRAERLVVSAGLAKNEVAQIMALSKLPELSAEDLRMLEEKLLAEPDGVLSAKYVDLIPQEYVACEV